jgi:hypothetical protein
MCLEAAFHWFQNSQVSNSLSYQDFRGYVPAARHAGECSLSANSFGDLSPLAVDFGIFAQSPFRSVLSVLISGAFGFQLPVPAILAILAI